MINFEKTSIVLPSLLLLGTFLRFIFYVSSKFFSEPNTGEEQSSYQCLLVALPIVYLVFKKLSITASS